MELTHEHLHVAFNAWAAAQDGGGVVLEEPGLFPTAHELCEAGWLRRRFVTAPGELSWWWTPQGDVALELGALTTGHSPN